MDSKDYTAPVAARLAGLSFRRLDYAVRSGLLRASVAEGRGHGHPRRFSFRDVLAARIVARLRERVSLQAVRKVQRELRRFAGADADLAAHRLVVRDGRRPDVAVVDPSGGDFMSLLREPGQHVAATVVLDLAPVVREVQERADRLKAQQQARKGAKRRRKPFAA